MRHYIQNVASSWSTLNKLVKLAPKVLCLDGGLGGCSQRENSDLRWEQFSDSTLVCMHDIYHHFDLENPM